MGIDASNKDYDRFEQVEKKQAYRLAESAGKEEFDDEFVIRTCDIGPFLHGDGKEKQKFAQEFGSALQEIGFAILVGHGIEAARYDQMKQVVLDFFSSTTIEERMKYRAGRHGSVSQGYFPIQETSRMHPDMVEGWVFCRRAFDLKEDPNASFDPAPFHPRPEFEPRLREHVLLHEPLFLPIMQSLLMYLGCDPHLYDKKLTRTNFGLRLNYYPPIGDKEDASGAGRILGHEDVDLFTLLPAPDIEGLQVLNRRNMKWVRVQAPPGSIIINTGDYMQRISNDILPSTTHRVSKPRDRSLFDRPRISFPIAVYVWENEMLEVLPGIADPKYEPVKAVHFHTRITSKFYGDDYAAPDAE